MNKAFILFLLLTANLFAADESKAANITQDLGVIQQGTMFEAKHQSEWFQDTYTFSVLPNQGTGAAAINAHFVGSSGIKFGLVQIWDGAKYWAMESINTLTHSSFFGKFVGLTCTNCKLIVEGHSYGADVTAYNGNWTIVNDVAAVPVPSAIWLFGSALVGLIRLNRRGVK